MKKWAISFVTGLVAVAMFLPIGLASDSNLPPPPGSQLIPAGSLLHVRLTCTLTSKTSKPGDPFTGIVTTPISADGKEIIGEGSTVEGHVAFVKQSGRVSESPKCASFWTTSSLPTTSSWHCLRALTI